MTNMKKTLAILILGLIARAQADDIQIQMTGNIYANTCIIDSASRNLTVDLGQAVSGGKTLRSRSRIALPHLRWRPPFSMVRPTVRTRQNSPISAVRKGWLWNWQTARTIYSLPRRQPLTFRLTQRTTRQRFLWLPAIMPAHCPSPPERLIAWSR